MLLNTLLIYFIIQQAARKYKVPSRTLYDKIKKLGISTTPRRVASTGNKIRNQKLDSNQDREFNHDENSSASAVAMSCSGGGLVSEQNEALSEASKLQHEVANLSFLRAAKPLPQFPQFVQSESKLQLTNNDVDNNIPLDLQIPKPKHSIESNSSPLSHSSYSSILLSQIENLKNANPDDPSNQHHPLASKPF